MPVEMTNRQARPVPQVRIRRLARRVLSALGATEAELSIAFVDDAQMRELNRRYRRLDRTTDVLAFAQGERGLLGDVVISVETAVRRVGTRRLPAELGRYLVHGILHLMGWDHHAPAERRAMRRQERQLWSAVWIDDIS